MKRRIGAAMAVLLGLFALGALSQMPATAVQGQAVTFTPAPIDCASGTPVQGGTIPIGVVCLTGTATASPTRTPTLTQTPTNTATPTPVTIYLTVLYNYYGGKEITVFYQPAGCITVSDYRFDVDYGDGRPHVIAAPPTGGCPNGGSSVYTPPAPNYGTGVFTITVTISQVNPPAQARLIRTAQTVVNTRPTATPTMTGTPTNTPTATRTNTPFIVTNRQYQPFIRR